MTYEEAMADEFSFEEQLFIRSEIVDVDDSVDVDYERIPADSMVYAPGEAAALCDGSGIPSVVPTLVTVRPRSFNA